jgi:hypothetical protein
LGMSGFDTQGALDIGLQINCRTFCRFIHNILPLKNIIAL